MEKKINGKVTSEENLDKNQLIGKIEKILKSNKTTYEKKIALFNLVVKGLEVEKSDFEKEQRVNYLLQSHLYNELSKQSMKEYKKTTVHSLSKVH